MTNRLERCYDFLDWLGMGCDILLSIIIWAGLIGLSWLVIWGIISGVAYTLGA